MEGRFRCNSAGLDSQAAAGGLRANGHDCDVLPFVAFQCASPFEFPGDETRRSCGTLAGIGKTYYPKHFLNIQDYTFLVNSILIKAMLL